jgi:hypothetical protein
VRILGVPFPQEIGLHKIKQVQARRAEANSAYVPQPDVGE